MIEGPPLESDGATLLGALARNAVDRPDRDAVRFLATGEDTTASISYSELQRRVDTAAGGLVARGLAGRPIVLALPPGIAFVTAVLATFRAGAYAVTIPFPAGASGERIAAIVADARPAAVLATRGEETSLPGASAGLGGATAGLPVWTLDELGGSGTLPPEPVADHPALIQYSSGSTRAPCGVVITHGNLAANVAMIESAFGVDSDVVAVNWLPPFHDMGLIGAILAPLFLGGTAVLMPSAAFLAKPLRWLRAIERHRGSVAGAPNFGFELCTRRVPPDAARELDLTSWTLAFCGSEPIRPHTLEAFARRFEPSRFSRDAFLACYGLAETTLLSSAGPLREIPSKTEGVPFSRVSCGRPAPGCGIEVFGDRGEICITGPHVSPGRWSGERGAVVPWADAYERDGRRFVRTGDLGMIRDGEIIVLDRLKDVIAMYGRKVHAVDVERAVLEAENGAVVAAAAFAIPSERGEHLVTLCELSARELGRLDHATLKSALGGAVSAATGIAPKIVLLRHGALARTSSGKIRRHVCRSDYLAGLQAEAMQRKALTPEQVERFRRDGIVFPVPAIGADEAADVLRKLEALEAARAGRLPPAQNANPHLLLPWLWDIVHDSRIVDAVEDLLGPDLLCWGTSFVNKKPADGRHVTWHQDATHWGLSSPEAVTAWIALTPSNRHSGCVRAVTGSHDRPQPHDHPEDPRNMLGRRERVLTEIDARRVVDVELAPGEMSLHHPLVIHGSEPNSGPRRRTGFAIRYIPAHVRQDGDKRKFAALVRGRDFGHFDREQRPAAPFDPAAVRHHARALRSEMAIIFENAPRGG